eukprot:SM001231S25740  [mRNA]  locus=s1231:69:1819:- [translate_table: standard]
MYAHAVEYTLADSSFRGLAYPSNVSNPLGSCGHSLSDGTVLVAGGWSKTDANSFVAVRKFLSSVNGTTDFAPDMTYLSQRRFRAAAHRMPNGNVVFVGGKSDGADTDDASHQSRSYEFLVKAAKETYHAVALLAGTLVYDLYPILHLLPSGNFFLFANTQSSYAGLILVCGGGSPPTSSCATLDTSLAAPTWSYEDMPGPRTISSLVVLPTSSMLIINGAAAGSADANGASSPVLTPYLLDSSLPVGSAGRFTVLNSSSTVRMFQATALLAPDATVIVAGGNPAQAPGTAKYVVPPASLSVEAFSPPYLRTGVTRPTITSAPATLAYGAAFLVSFSVPGGAVAAYAAFIDSGYSTGGLTMGQRMVKAPSSVLSGSGPAYGLASMAPANSSLVPPGFYLLFVIVTPAAGAPPVPSKATWVQIGVDSAQPPSLPPPPTASPPLPPPP